MMAVVDKADREVVVELGVPLSSLRCQSISDRKVRKEVIRSHFRWRYRVGRGRGKIDQGRGGHFAVCKTRGAGDGDWM